VFYHVSGVEGDQIVSGLRVVSFKWTWWNWGSWPLSL